MSCCKVRDMHCTFQLEQIEMTRNLCIDSGTIDGEIGNELQWCCCMSTGQELYVTILTIQYIEAAVKGFIKAAVRGFIKAAVRGLIEAAVRGFTQ